MKPLFISTIVILGVLLLTGFDEASAASLTPSLSVPSVTVEVRFGCKMQQGKLVCGNSKKHDDDADNDDQSKTKKKTGNICEGDNHCGAGETDLETPNKYKACCEPAGGFQTAPKAPATTEAKECGFGMIGTPPNNCDCPAGTEFMGNKGCVASRYTCVTDSVVKKDGGYLGQGYSLTTAAANESEARSEFFDGIDKNGWKLNGKVTCKKE